MNRAASSVGHLSFDDRFHSSFTFSSIAFQPFWYRDPFPFDQNEMPQLVELLNERRVSCIVIDDLKGIFNSSPDEFIAYLHELKYLEAMDIRMDLGQMNCAELSKLPIKTLRLSSFVSVHHKNACISLLSNPHLKSLHLLVFKIVDETNAACLEASYIENLTLHGLRTSVNTPSFEGSEFQRYLRNTRSLKSLTLEGLYDFKFFTAPLILSPTISRLSLTFRDLSQEDFHFMSEVLCSCENITDVSIELDVDSKLKLDSIAKFVEKGILKSFSLKGRNSKFRDSSSMWGALVRCQDLEVLAMDMDCSVIHTVNTALIIGKPILTKLRTLELCNCEHNALSLSVAFPNLTSVSVGEVTPWFFRDIYKTKIKKIELRDAIPPAENDLLFKSIQHEISHSAWGPVLIYFGRFNGGEEVIESMEKFESLLENNGIYEGFRINMYLQHRNVYILHSAFMSTITLMALKRFRDVFPKEMPRDVVKIMARYLFESREDASAWKVQVF